MENINNKKANKLTPEKMEEMMSHIPEEFRLKTSIEPVLKKTTKIYHPETFEKMSEKLKERCEYATFMSVVNMVAYNSVILDYCISILGEFGLEGKFLQFNYKREFNNLREKSINFATYMSNSVVDEDLDEFGDGMDQLFQLMTQFIRKGVTEKDCEKMLWLLKNYKPTQESKFNK